MERGINQLEGALATLLTDPSDRRIIISGWRLDEFDNMALPPCHVDKRFVALESDKTLHMVMTIRSWDLFLGGPFNIASEAVFLAVMARMIGYTAATLTIQAANAHLYDDHFSQIQAQLQREPKALPTLVLGPSILECPALADVPGAFARIQPEDIQLEGYEHWPALPAPMAV
jgi:thymidylate synthase